MGPSMDGSSGRPLRFQEGFFMTKKELSDNLLFLAALEMLERLTGQGLLSPEEAAQAKKELEKQVRPTVILV